MENLEEKNHNDVLLEEFEDERYKILIKIRDLEITKVQIINDKENALRNNITEKIKYYEINYERELREIKEEKDELLSEMENLSKKLKENLIYEDEYEEDQSYEFELKGKLNHFEEWENDIEEDEYDRLEQSELRNDYLSKNNF